MRFLRLAFTLIVLDLLDIIRITSCIKLFSKFNKYKTSSCAKIAAKFDNEVRPDWLFIFKMFCHKITQSECICKASLLLQINILSQHQPLVFTNIGYGQCDKKWKVVQNYLQRLCTRYSWVLI